MTIRPTKPQFEVGQIVTDRHTSFGTRVWQVVKKDCYSNGPIYTVMVLYIENRPEAVGSIIGNCILSEEVLFEGKR